MSRFVIDILRGNNAKDAKGGFSEFTASSWQVGLQTNRVGRKSAMLTRRRFILISYSLCGSIQPSLLTQRAEQTNHKRNPAQLPDIPSLARCTRVLQSPDANGLVRGRTGWCQQGLEEPGARAIRMSNSATRKVNAQTR